MLKNLLNSSSLSSSFDNKESIAYLFEQYVSLNNNHNDNSIEIYLKSVIHSLNCRNQNCSNEKCAEFKLILKHIKECQDQSCKFCDKFNFILFCHSKKCTNNICWMPICKDIKNILK
jgi:hypothetical protein